MTQRTQDLEQELVDLGHDMGFIGAVAAIRRGKFVRDPDDPAYAPRLVYTRHLRRFVYDPAAMNLILSSPALKERFFRTFGYRGALDFTIYPNAWLRDLPLLDIGSGAYLADGIVLGTNQVATDQRTLRVEPIRIGARTIFDQQCMVGLGTTIGADCVIGVGTHIGLRTRLGDGVSIAGACKIAHFASIGDGAVLGYDVILAPGAVVDPGVAVPDFARIPAKAHVTRDGVRMHGDTTRPMATA